MTGVELLVLLAVAYAVVSPDKFSLAATRGAAGAARGATRAGRAGSARNAGRGAGRKGKAASKRAGSSTRKGSRRPGRLRAMAAGAAQGWRDGVASARQRRDEGRDTVGRAKRAAGWTKRHADTAQKAHRARKAAKAAKLDAAKNAHTTDPETPEAVISDPPAPADDNPTQVSGPAAETKKGTPVTVTTTDLESLSSVEAETKNAQTAAAEIIETWAALKAWAAALPDRWSGTPWSTTALDDAIGSVGESTTPEGMHEALQGLSAAAEKAHSVGEVAAEQGAKGDVDRFAS